MARSIIPFPKSATAGSHSTTQLLKAARTAYAALMLAFPAGEKNAVIRNLGGAIRAVEGCNPPTSPSFAVRLTGEVAAKLLRDVRSELCFCGRNKVARKPFCLRCYHSLPIPMRAAMYLFPLDSNQIFDRILESRVYLTRLGMLSASEEIA